MINTISLFKRQNISFTSNQTYVVGHKNPDTDSVCSAVATAKLATTLDPSNQEYIPVSAGNINEETAFALAYFGIKTPKVKEDVSLTIGEAMSSDYLSKVSIKKDTSIKEFIDLVHNKDIKTAVVLNDDDTIAGVVSRKSLVDFLISPLDYLKKLKEYNVTFETIKNLINAEVITGTLSLEDTIKGDILTGAYSNEKMLGFDLKNSIVIAGDRQDIQKEVIENGAKALIVARSTQIAPEVIELAKEKNVIILASDLGVAKILTNLQQATPVSTIMEKNVVTFDIGQSVDEACKEVKKNNFNYFPVLEDGKFVGMINRMDVLAPDNKGVILVDHNNPSQFVDGIDKDNIKGILDHHLQQLTLDSSRVAMTYKPVGACATLVAREYFANGVSMPPEIAGILWCAIISDTDKFTSVTTKELDIKTAKQLASIAKIKEPEVLANKLLAKRDANLEKLSKSELLKSDLKTFKAKGGAQFAIGQIKPYQGEKYVKMADKLRVELNKYEKENSLDGAVLMITDLSQNATYLVVSDKICKKAKKALAQADDKFLKKQINQCPMSYGTVLNAIKNGENPRLQNVQSRKEQVQTFITQLLEIV